MAKAKNSTQVLKAAKWILENVGWVQKTWARYDSTGTKIIGVCASSALAHVDAEKWSTYEHARQRLTKAMGTHIVSFNDNPRTTKKAVINAFNRAIKGSK